MVCSETPIESRRGREDGGWKSRRFLPHSRRFLSQLPTSAFVRSSELYIEEGLKTEEKAKAVAAVGGQNLANSLPPQLFALGRFEEQDELDQDALKVEQKRMNSSNSSKSSYSAKQLPRQGIKYILSPETSATIFAFSSVFILLLRSRTFTHVPHAWNCHFQLCVILVRLRCYIYASL